MKMPKTRTQGTTKVRISYSPNQTIQIGRAIGSRLKAGTVIALIGALGCGKTTLVKGLATGLGVRNQRQVRSPSFVIFHTYRGRVPLYHFDLFRLNDRVDWAEIGMEEYLQDPGAVSVIEWADRIPQILEQANVEIRMSAPEPRRRVIRLRE